MGWVVSWGIEFKGASEQPSNDEKGDKKCPKN